MTGDEKYARWHRMIHDYAHKYFHDPEHGEWCGYLHQGGRVSTPMKGNHYKDPFHLPRMQSKPTISKLSFQLSRLDYAGQRELC